MKKTTFYTLLCTTIILPGTLLAAQPQEGLGTPIGKAAKLREQQLMNGAPKTPQLREEQKALYANNALLSPDTKALYVELGTAEARKKRDEEQQAKLEQVLSEASQKRLERELQQEEEKRLKEKAEQEELVRKAREAALQKQEANAALEKKIAELTEQVKNLGERLNNGAEVKKLSAKTIKEMSEELKLKSAQLATAQEQLRESQNQNQVLVKRATRAEEGEGRLAEGLNAIIIEKEAGNAGGGDQGGAGQGQGGGGAVIVNDGAQGLPQNIAQPNINAGAVKERKEMRKANFGAQKDDQKDGQKDGQKDDKL